MSTTLGMALLGFLAREDLTGYDLSRSMKGPISHFWQVRHSQVYPELARLEQEGMVEHLVVPQTGKPDRKVFSITPKGRDALGAWLQSPLEPVPIRSEPSLRAYCVAQTEPQGALAFFRGEARRHRDTLKTFEGYQAELEALPGTELRDVRSEAFAHYAVVMRGVAFERAQAEWYDWMVAHLEG